MILKSRSFCRTINAAWYDKLRDLVKRKKKGEETPSWQKLPTTQHSTEFLQRQKDLKKKKKETEEVPKVGEDEVQDIDELLGTPTGELMDKATTERMLPSDVAEAVGQKPKPKVKYDDPKLKEEQQVKKPGKNIPEPWAFDIEPTYLRDEDTGDILPVNKFAPEIPKETPASTQSSSAEAQTGITPEKAAEKQEQEEKGKTEEEKKEEEKKKREEAKKRAAQIDTSILGDRSDRQVLADARAIAVEMHKQLVDDSSRLLSRGNEIQQLLNGRGPNTLRNLLERMKPGATKVAGIKQFVRQAQVEQVKSTYQTIIDKINDVLITWTTLVNEKKSQTKVYEKVLRKLRLPQFQLPAWLEWYATGVAPDIIKKKRQERYDQTVRDLLDSRRPLSKSQKRLLSDTIRSEVDKLGIQDRVVENVFKQYPSSNFVKEYYSKRTGLRDSLNRIRDRLVYNFSTGEFYEETPPPQVVQSVEQDIQKAIEEYQYKTNKDLKVPPDAIKLWIRAEMRERDEIVEAVKKRLEYESKYPKADSSRRTVLAQTSIQDKMKGVVQGLKSGKADLSQGNGETQTEPSNEETPPRKPPNNEKNAKLLRAALEQVMQTLEDVRKEDMWEIYAQTLKAFGDPNFAASLRALGAKWVKEHGEGSGASYGLIETTRQGDGEKLLTLFDEPTGLATQSMKLLRDYIEHIGTPLLDEAITDLADLAEVQTPSSEEARKRTEGEEDVQDTDKDGIPDKKDDDIDGDGKKNQEDPDADGDGIPDEQDPSQQESKQPTDGKETTKVRTLEQLTPEEQQELSNRLLNTSRINFVKGVEDLAAKLTQKPNFVDYDIKQFLSLQEPELKEKEQEFQEGLPTLMRSYLKEGITPESVRTITDRLAKGAIQSGEKYAEQKVEKVKEALATKEVSEEAFTENVGVVLSNLDKTVPEIVDLFFKQAKLDYDPNDKDEADEAKGETHPQDTSGEEKNPPDERK